ncbi:TonB system transport protein ExbD [Paracoccus marinus]|uniref:TonB system transport protein ExbD n=1 Tax=Paracoccus marinus TaxID=288426 RepID=UPI001180A44A|nr:TonB system transport protein ExbD [Paracoccus marinus]GLS81786.1 TonB system transport protein ExbD [Paracoccus marinus]
MAGGIRDTGDTGDPGGDELSENHEINVTPFIDVMLVLLIIFMVAAPLATVDVNVDLPVSNAPASGRPDTPLWLTVGADGTLSLGNEQVARDALPVALQAATGGDTEQRIFLRADQSVAYGELMTVMNGLRDAGFLKIALVGLDRASAPPAALGAGSDGAAPAITAPAAPAAPVQ